MRNFSVAHRTITEIQLCCLLPNDFLVYLLLTILNTSSLPCTQCVHTCTCVCILTHKGDHKHTCKYMHMNVHTCIHSCAHTQARTHTRARTHTCTYTHTHTHTKAMCLSNDRSLKYTCTTPQPPATSNLLILRPTTNFITIFCHLVVLSCIICSVLNRFFSLSPHTPQKSKLLAHHSTPVISHPGTNHQQ